MAVEWTTNGNREVETVTGDVRYIFICKKCGAETVDYTTSNVSQYVNGRQILKGDKTYRRDGQVVNMLRECSCPMCGQSRKGAAVRAILSQHTCDSRCMGATGPLCECSCGGANHGASHLH